MQIGVTINAASYEVVCGFEGVERVRQVRKSITNAEFYGLEGYDIDFD